MAEYFIARQPIFNAKLKLHAYELLFRNSKTNRAPEAIADNHATADVLTTSTEIGLDRLVGDRLAFINVPHRFLQEPDLMPIEPDRAVLEILETVDIDEAALEGMRVLREQGFSLALDDFIYDESYDAALPLIDTIKLDVQAIVPEDWDKHISQLKSSGCKLRRSRPTTNSKDWLRWAVTFFRAISLPNHK
jgi:EAL and modified HD-GYP domain-containing signal transduction protein